MTERLTAEELAKIATWLKKFFQNSPEGEMVEKLLAAAEERASLRQKCDENFHGWEEAQAGWREANSDFMRLVAAIATHEHEIKNDDGTGTHRINRKLWEVLKWAGGAT